MTSTRRHRARPLSLSPDSKTLFFPRCFWTRGWYSVEIARAGRSLVESRTAKPRLDGRSLCWFAALISPALTTVECRLFFMSCTQQKPAPACPNFQPIFTAGTSRQHPDTVVVPIHLSSFLREAVTSKLDWAFGHWWSDDNGKGGHRTLKSNTGGHHHINLHHLLTVYHCEGPHVGCRGKSEEVA